MHKLENQTVWRDHATGRVHLREEDALHENVEYLWKELVNMLEVELNCEGSISKANPVEMLKWCLVHWNILMAVNSGEVETFFKWKSAGTEPDNG